MSHFLLGQRRKGVPSLKEVASRALTLTANRDLLGNVGGLPMELIKPILVHFSPTELARVEDLTWEHAGLDITCDTWPLWQKHCRVTHGEPDMAEVDPFDPDNQEELPLDSGDYRTYFYKKEKVLEERRRQTAQQARSIMEVNRQQKEKNKVKIIDSFTPKKRRNGRGGFEPSRSAPKSSGDFFKTLGISNKSRFHRKSISLPPTASVMNKPAKLSTAGAAGMVHGSQPIRKMMNHRSLPQAAPRRTVAASNGQTTVNKKRVAHSLFGQRDLQRANAPNNVQIAAKGMRMPGGQNRAVPRAQQPSSVFPQTQRQGRISTNGKEQSRLNLAKQTQRPNVLGGQNAMRKRGGDILARPNQKLPRRS